MQILKKTLLVALAATALTATPVFAEDVKLGFIGGFTGSLESLTPPIFDAAKLAADQVNAQGGILEGDTLVFIAGDEAGGDAATSANAADKLINTDGVVGLVGPMRSGAVIAAANNAAIPGNVVLITPSGTAPVISTLDDNDLVFRTTPSDAYQGEQLAKLLISKGITEVAITYVNNDYGKGLSDVLSDVYTQDGGSVIANEAHEDSKADYRAELGSIASTGAETLVIIAYADGSGQTILRQAVESGNFTSFVGVDGVVSDTLFTGIDTAAVEGMIATKPGTPDVPGSKIYAGLATAAGQDPSAIFGPQGYDGAFLLALAIEKNGSTDREGLSAALREVSSAPGEIILPGEWEKAKALIAAGKDVNYEGASGSHEFDANGDVPGVIVEMMVKNGSFTEVGRINN